MNLSFLHRKAATHDNEIQHLYEEMEQQIKNEKDRIVLQVKLCHPFHVIVFHIKYHKCFTSWMFESTSMPVLSLL